MNTENDDREGNLQDADIPADLADPRIDSWSATGDDDTRMDNESDGDRQLTTHSDALDTGLNDSDLGADAAGLDPERERYAAGGAEAVERARKQNALTGLGTVVRD